MKNFINKVLESTRWYTVWDFGILKISLMCFGILLGAYFSDFFLSKITFIWIIYIVTFIYIMYKTFKTN